MGPVEAAIIGTLAVLFFGSKRIPKAGHALGETVGIIRSEADDDITSE